MTMLNDKDTDVIRLEGRIDSNNAPAVEAMILARIKDMEGDSIRFDASDLEYISSAGLRVLMKVSKLTGKKPVICEVSPEIYDIFEVTGFTELCDISKRRRRVSVEGCKVIGKGFYGTVYRLDEDTALETLQQILLFRELEFPLRQIQDIITSPDYDKSKALAQQITLLTLQKERLERLIRFAQGIQAKGGTNMDFTAFDRSKLDEYAKRAKEAWGNTKEYQETVEKQAARTEAENDQVIRGFMRLFTEFGGMRDMQPDAEPVQQHVKRLQDYITTHWYTCTDQILQGLGQMYAAGGEFTENIDRAGGEGTAAFTAAAITAYCAKAQ